MNVAPSMAECMDLQRALPGVRALDQAVAAGDAGAVRAHAAQLLNDFSDIEDIRARVGHALLFIGDAAEALLHLPADAHLERGFALGALGRHDEARREVAIAEEQGDPGARSAAVSIENVANKARRSPANADPVEAEMWRSATEHWRRGEWDAGMAAYVQMCHRSDRIGIKPLNRVGGVCPAWSGELVNHLLVICHRDGNGDLLQFGRYIAAARARCWHLTLACEEIMHSLMQRVLPVDTVVGFNGISLAKQQADAYHGRGHVVCQRAEDEIWRADANQADRGLSTGSGRRRARRPVLGRFALGPERSVRFTALSPLQFLPGVHFHSLQVGTAAEEAGPWVKRHALSSYEDTTSLIAALDAVISVDTSVAHLAGNIGKPTHLLLCRFEDCRWGMGDTGDTTPWYPSMLLYRGNLGKAVNKIATRLRELGEAKGATLESAGQAATAIDQEIRLAAAASSYVSGLDAIPRVGDEILRELRGKDGEPPVH